MRSRSWSIANQATIDRVCASGPLAQVERTPSGDVPKMREISLVVEASTAAHRLVITLERPHDALGDAAATAAVLPHLLAAHGITDADQLEPFYVR